MNPAPGRPTDPATDRHPEPVPDPPATTRRLAADYVASLDNRDWPRLASLLADDVVYEMPQTGERIHGRDRVLQFNQEYPGDWQMTAHRITADTHHAALWLHVRVGEETTHACVWLDTTTGHITRITDFWPEPYEPPTGREHLTGPR